MTTKIEGKIALVTGANRGIGKAIVEALLASGAAKVYLGVRNVESTTEIATIYGDRVETIQMDIADKTAVQAAANEIPALDIVINNAGILLPGGPLETSASVNLEKELQVNLFGLLNVATAFTPHLRASKGTLVQLNSVVSIRNFANFSTYSVSKAAAYSLTQSLRESLSESGVKVISVHPGPIATDMGDVAGFDQAPPPSVVADSIVSAIDDDTFHVFPDEMAKQFEAGYQSYAEAFVTAEL